MKKINRLILSIGLALFFVIIAVSIGFYLIIHLPQKDSELIRIEKQKLELQQKQIDLDSKKLLMEQQATVSAIQKTDQTTTKIAPNVDCEKIARDKAREILAKLIQMEPDNQEYKKAYDAGLGRTSDIDRYFDQCMQSNGLSNSINVKLK